MQKITFLFLLFTVGIFSQTIQMPNIPEDGVVYETKTLNSTFSIPPADSWDFSDFEPVDEYIKGFLYNHIDEAVSTQRLTFRL